MVVLVARQGRELQRYSPRTGGRIVVGCIPYLVREDGELEVLVISSQKGHDMMFPKGGWEIDDSMDDAARREALEEVGVRGELLHNLAGGPQRGAPTNPARRLARIAAAAAA